MLDTVTLRVVFSILALTMFVLFYWGTYRPTRSAYSGWWCAALASFMVGAAAFLLDGTAQQWWANPLGNVGLVLGTTAVWAGARSLRESTPLGWWRIWAAPAAVAVVSLLDDSATNDWSGAYLFLALMSMFLGLAGVELWLLWRAGAEARASQAPYWHAVRTVALVTSALSIYYLGRWATFVAVGPDAPLFAVYFGSAATTLITTVLLVIVSFSMSTLSNEQETQELRVRASRDGLTGLLNRTEFLRLASAEADRSRRRGAGASVILADLDHFKEINDRHGHAAGDAVLRLFAAACQESVRSTDVVGRLGGEEFVMLLPGATPRRAESVAAEISRRLRATALPDGLLLPTVSYGIACADPLLDLEGTIADADAALYRAKALGRDRAISAEPRGAASSPPTAQRDERGRLPAGEH